MPPTLRQRIFWLVALAILVWAMLAWWKRTPRQFEWLASSPGNSPPHFKFLGPYAWKVNGWWSSMKRRFTGPEPSNQLLTTLYFIDSTENLVPPTNVIWRATNQFGDEAWLLRRPQRLTAVTRDNEGYPRTASISFGNGQQALLSSINRVPIYRRGETNTPLQDIGYWIDASVKRDRAGFDSMFFLTTNERLREPDGHRVYTTRHSAVACTYRLARPCC